MDTLKAVRLLGDEARVRILRLLRREELSVAELQEILGMGQSRISMQLSQLKQAGFVNVKRSGQKSLYRASIPPNVESLVTEVLDKSAEEIPESGRDDEGLRMALDRRKDHLRDYFNDLAGRFGREYVPGRSWKALTELMMRLLPALEIADLGAGEATLAIMLSQRAKRVIAVDSSDKMVEYGAGLAAKHGIRNLEYRRGDLEDLPVESESVDLVLMHQVLHHALHPEKALAESYRILRPGGRFAVMDLKQHEVEAARELYADVHLGFSLVGLRGMLESVGFREIHVDSVDRSADPAHFETILGVGEK